MCFDENNHWIHRLDGKSSELLLERFRSVRIVTAVHHPVFSVWKFSKAELAAAGTNVEQRGEQRRAEGKTSRISSTLRVEVGALVGTRTFAQR